MYFYSKNGLIPLNIKLSLKRYAIDIVFFQSEIHKPNKPILLFDIRKFKEIQKYIDYGFSKIIIISGEFDDECNKKFGYIKNSKIKIKKNNQFFYKLFANNHFEKVFDRLPINNIKAIAHFGEEWIYTGLPSINLFCNRNSPIRLLAPIFNTYPLSHQENRFNYLSLFLENDGENKISIPVTKLIKIGNSYIQHWNISTSGFESAISVVFETFISTELCKKDKFVVPILLESYESEKTSIICPRLDCDEAISSADLLKKFYESNKLHLNLAITTNQFLSEVDKKFICETEENGSTISNHSHNHQPYWGLGDPIEKIYQDCLGRKPEKEVYIYYSNKLKEGAEIGEIEKMIKETDEFKSLNSDLIEKVYLKYLKRKADKEGYAIYSEKLKRGFSIKQIIKCIKSSEEFKNLYLNNDFLSDFRKSKEIIKNISSSRSITCVAPFHQSNQNLLKSLANNEVQLLISGNSQYSPEHMISIGGQITKDNKIGIHSQQCMLHGGSWPNLKEIYFESFMLCAKRQSIFGYLDHPISPRYDYEWVSKERQLNAHQDLIKLFKKYYRVESISHDELSKWLKIRSFIDLQVSSEDEIKAYVDVNKINNLKLEEKFLSKFRFCQVLYKGKINRCYINYQ